jgi:amino acid adenylation domain-containing protein
MNRLSESDLALSKDKQALLQSLLQQEGLAPPPPITQRGTESPAPLSCAQERLWFLDQLEPGTPAYNIPLAYQMTGKLDVAALRRSFDDLLALHESLRTTFVTVDGEPFQIIAPTLTLDVPVIDLQHLSQSEQTREVGAHLDAMLEVSFKLESGPLLRVQLLRLNPSHHVMLFNIHHIIADALSLNVLFRQLAERYRTHIGSKPFPLAELPVQYGDYSVWQRQWVQESVLEKQLAYWKEQLDGELPILALPTDRPRPAVQSFRGKEKAFELPRALTASLRKLSQDHRTTLYMTLLAAFKTLLYRYTGQEEILVGSPIANRKHVEFEEMVGFFANTLVLRSSLAGNPTFVSLLKRIRRLTLAAYENQDLPFARVIRELHPERTTSHNPLFQAMFDFQNAGETLPDWYDLEVTPLEMANKTAKFDLTLQIVEEEERLKGWLEYSTSLFEDATISRLIEHFQILLQGIISDPERRIAELPLLTSRERQRLLIDWNETGIDFEPGSIHQLFEAQVERSPEAVAVVFGDERLTYDELNRRANQLAHRLRDLGVGPDVVVGILVERSPAMIVALLGVLKAGGAYLPLDPAHPFKRNQFMLQDTEAFLLLTQHRFSSHLPGKQHCLYLDADWALFAKESNNNLSLSVEPQHLAYVIYTSGSTGMPKGVMIHHGGLANYLNWAVRTYPISDGRGVPVHSSIGFDLTITALFVPLLAGQAVQLLPGEMSGINSLSSTLEQSEDHSLIKLTPAHVSLLNHVIPAEMAAGKTHSLVIGGEQLTAEDLSFWRQHAPKTRLFNEYGPTETVVGCCMYEVPPDEETLDFIPIGRPISNTQLYILDDHLNVVPIGVVGELYVGGAGVGRGYVNRPELTAESFIPDPFGSKAGSRLYRTGDLAHYLPDGTIQYVGRGDDQVNLRGYRIELREIEVVLSRHPSLQKSIVMLREDEPGEKRLVAYVVSGGKKPPAASELRRYLSNRLPAYMVPSAFVFLDVLPLSSNQKPDREALPAPERVQLKKGDALVSAHPSEVENQLVRIWEELLQVQPINPTDNFFDLGGHSLLAVRLFARIDEVFDTNLHITSLFQGATVQELAHLIRQQAGLKAWPSLVEIQPRRRKEDLPFYCVHGITGDVFWYGHLARYVGKTVSFYGIQSRGLDGILNPLTKIEDMAERYVEEICAFQPEGPYLLGGYSSGGNLAFEMAQQLQARGREVALLLIIDDVPSNSDYFRLSWKPRFLVDLLRSARYRLQDVFDLTPGEFLTRIGRKAKVAGKQISILIDSPDTQDLAYTAEDLIDDAKELPDHVRGIIELNYRAVESYLPKPYLGRITLLRAAGERIFTSHDPEMGWGKLASGGVEVEVLPGSHLGIFREPYIRFLAERVRDHIERAQRNGRR